MIRQETKMNERNVRRKVLQTLRKNVIPQYGRQFCYEGITLYGQSKPQHTEMIVEINSIPKTCFINQYESEIRGLPLPDVR
jgi:hypothetical protein